MVGTGASEILQSALLALVDAGDEVILFEPWFDIYSAGVSLAHGTRVGVPMSGPNLRPDLTALRAAVTPRTRLIILNSPSNPTGAVYSRAELEALAAVALRHNCYVMSDEIYEHLTYGKHVFSSMPTLVPEIADRCVIVNGVAKTYAMTGWRVGWMIGPKDVMKAAINFQSHSTSNVSNVAQIAALEAVRGDLSAVAMMREAFQRRSLTMHRMLNEIPGVVAIEPQDVCGHAGPSSLARAGLTLRFIALACPGIFAVSSIT